MNNSRINLRYATALLEFAAERNQIEETYNDVQLMAQVIRQNKELRLLLKSPVVFSDKKLSILNQIFKEKVGKVTFGFIEILLRKRREEALSGILESFIQIYRKSKNIKTAQVTTSVPLDNQLKDQLHDLLSKQTGSQIIIEEIVDPDILGGLIVKVEGVKFDDSIRKKINNLRKEFNTNTYIKGF